MRNGLIIPYFHDVFFLLLLVVFIVLLLSFIVQFYMNSIFHYEVQHNMYLCCLFLCHRSLNDSVSTAEIM